MTWMPHSAVKIHFVYRFTFSFPGAIGQSPEKGLPIRQLYLEANISCDRPAGGRNSSNQSV